MSNPQDERERMTLGYTTADDGVHLECDQHDDLGTLDFGPTVEQVADRAAAHRREHHPRNPDEPSPEEVQAATELLHQALEAWGALMVINDRGLNRVDGDAHEIAAALIHAGWTPPTRKES